MQSLSTNHRTGLPLVRPSGRTKRSLTSKSIKPALPHAKGSHDNAGIDITSVSLALLVSLSASPAFAESDSYEDMLKKFKSKQADTVKQYEKAAKTSSNLIATPSPPVSDKLPFSSFFGGSDEKKAEAPAAQSSSPASSFSAPKMDLPKFDTPKMPDMPSFSAPKMPSFSVPKFDMPKVPDMPKMDMPKFEAPTLPSAPATPPPAPIVKKAPETVAAPVAVPKPIAPVVKAPEPPVVVKPYVPPPPPTPVTPLPAPPVVPTPAPAAPTSSQGDFMERWQRDQTKAGSATKSVTSPQQRSSAAPAKKAAPPAAKKASRSGKRQGPLPLWLAEFLTLGLFVGFGAAILFMQDALKGIYNAADKAIGNATANFNKRQE